MLKKKKITDMKRNGQKIKDAKLKNKTKKTNFQLKKKQAGEH